MAGFPAKFGWLIARRLKAFLLVKFKVIVALRFDEKQPIAYKTRTLDLHAATLP